MTQKIYDTKAIIAHNSLWFSVGGGLFVALIITALLVKNVWLAGVPKAFAPTTEAIGKAILSHYLIPFEIVSFLLLGALIGAVYLARAEDKEK